MLTLGSITKFKSVVEPPEHHVIAASIAEAASGWTSYIPSWAPSPQRTRPSLSKSKVAGFRNPWPSWHRPTAAQKWDSFQWGDDDDGCIELAASHLTDHAPPQRPPQSKQPRFPDINDWPDSLGAKAARLLRVEDPDFSFPEGSKAKATWLGHAGVLVQLPPLDQNSRPVRCLFDPMFSARCSPSQFAGPIRSYPPPCTVQDLPPIDAVFISHNHYDHMDYDSLISVWRHSRDSVRFFVPLGNKKLLLEWGIPADRVTEMDWWDSAELTLPSSGSPTAASSRSLKVWCTPAQHNSFRTAGDADSTLWSSWVVESLSPTQPPYRVFFAGDTGYQFHADPSWPPSPNNLNKSHSKDQEKYEKFPACPAFAEIRTRIGPPNLLLLPVSVGATFAYLRSFLPLPNWINPFPRHSAGVTGANHMPPWDAVEVLRVMTQGEEGGGDGDGDGKGGVVEGEPAVAVALHWGTFVTDPGEVLKTLGGLEFACKRQGVRFARELKGVAVTEDVGGEAGRGREPVFVAVNQGGSVCV